MSRGLTFIPTPHVTNLDSIKNSVSQFNRKIKLQYYFSEKERTNPYDDNYEKQEFTEPSDWEPPDENMPAKVHQVLQQINEQIVGLVPSKEKCNLSVRQVSALKNLKNKKHLIIKKADKGSACVVMNKTNYVLEATRQLDNVNHYKKINEPIFPQTTLK